MSGVDDITILMPCRDQKDSFLASAVDSVLAQSDPRWQLIIIVDQQTPATVRDRLESYKDERIRYIINKEAGLGGALNTGIHCAETDFVGILLSDDVLAPQTVAVLRQQRQRNPEVDFFHSSRRYMNAQGQPQGPIMQSLPRFQPDHFSKNGSPVKHFLCWRRAMGLEIGGFDQSLSVHGCDDFDFPWRMSEAGACFRAIPHCLYYYRLHNEFDRLTTHTSLQTQVDTLSAMFRKHQVSEPETSRYIRSALETYLVEDAHFGRDQKQSRWLLECFGEVTQQRLVEHLNRGGKERHFFPHQIYHIAKGGPDGLKLANRMLGVLDPATLREIVLYADPSNSDDFPDQLFFDDDIIWHQQQFGRKGQVAIGSVVLDGSTMHVLTYVSDLVQRIGRRREFKTQIETRFNGWSRMLHNAMMAFAVEHGVETYYSATSALAARHADPARQVDPQLFERVYDQHLCEMFHVDREGDWWRVDVRKNTARIVIPTKQRRPEELVKTICICHDIERGLGYRQSDPQFAREIDVPAQAALHRMLELEAAAGVHGTYQVVGQLFNELRETIARYGHALAFHSFDHTIEGFNPIQAVRQLASRMAGKEPSLDSRQLQKCREIDYRIKGYRPPQSRLTADVSDARLAYYNFEWMASSAWSLGFTLPRLDNAVVKIPIAFDDFDLHQKRMTIDQWFERVLNTVRDNEFTAFSVHDCYASCWLDRYGELLNALSDLGEFKTLDEVCSQTLLGSCL